MGVGRFGIPVRVQLSRIERDRIVANTNEAAQILLHAWPVTDSENVLTQ
ncbi:hypothetical protein MAXJ12_18998 [Mesorhizobium alhagi CCNWXJ12-2]|uniref:DUF982 domain-containing protein n=1 Tax=Mesorhizobium alhagi CCNWXJ12-2 TaxID=1107882 RepID=H0HUF8_9HYPH|nr:hypothetical protein MAXJ12_18998 [Mesorhizobium alhagi CCNWXJ12-2]